MTLHKRKGVGTSTASSQSQASSARRSCGTCLCSTCQHLIHSVISTTLVWHVPLQHVSASHSQRHQHDARVARASAARVIIPITACRSPRVILAHASTAASAVACASYHLLWHILSWVLYPSIGLPSCRKPTWASVNPFRTLPNLVLSTHHAGPLRLYAE